MPSIIVTDRDGGEYSIEAKNGHKVMEIIRDAGLDIEAACGGCCACATCHVYVDAEWFPKLNAADEEEADMLDLAMDCLLYTSPSPRDQRGSRMPSSA